MTGCLTLIHMPHTTPDTPLCVVPTAQVQQGAMAAALEGSSPAGGQPGADHELLQTKGQTTAQRQHINTTDVCTSPSSQQDSTPATTPTVLQSYGAPSQQSFSSSSSLPEGMGGAGSPYGVEQHPALVQQLGVSVESLSRLFRADADTEFEQVGEGQCLAGRGIPCACSRAGGWAIANGRLDRDRERPFLLRISGKSRPRTQFLL